MDIHHSAIVAKKWMALGTDYKFCRIFFSKNKNFSSIYFQLYRFWKQGYWKTHLQSRSYHISALYVVDLKRFRKIAAGDRLRGQYQALSQDPNSLSNLDQVIVILCFLLYLY